MSNPFNPSFINESLGGDPILDPRSPDQDLESVFEHNAGDFPFMLSDIFHLMACVPGMNDGFHWHWIVMLKEPMDYTHKDGRPEYGRYAYINAWCDYTGWDCQSGGYSVVAETPEGAAHYAESGYEESNIKEQLLDQLARKQPYGCRL